MKTTVPNKEAIRPKSGQTVTSGLTKEQMKMKLEKELEDVNKQLVVSIKGKKSSDFELKLLERKVYTMLKLKQWKEVLEQGYKVLGKKGPDVIIYKCILVSLCRLGKFEDVIELLNHWKNSTPKCFQMSETLRKMDGYLTAIRSGMNATVLLQNIEEVLGLNYESIFSTNCSTESEPSWKFRPPPPRHNTFSICPRISSGTACIYVNDCLLAHSKEELKEWQFRSQWNSKKGLPDCSIESLHLLRSSQSSSGSLLPGPKEPIPPTYRLLPPACMYYLLGLVKKVKEADNIKNVLTENLPDVKIKYSTPLELRRTYENSAPVSHKWSFMIAARQPLATVTLLHDVNREHFGITGAYFFNSKKQSMDLVEMHPNNKSQKFIQVLNTFIRPDVFLPFNNGWPEWCCYQVDVTFQTSENSSTVYEQNIVFDFKNDPKVAKRLSITVEPHKIQDYNQAAILPKACYVSGSSNCEISSDTDENNSIEEELSPINERDSRKKNFSKDPWGRQSTNAANFEVALPKVILKPGFDLINSDVSLTSNHQYNRETENSLNIQIHGDDKEPKMVRYIASMRKIAMENYQLLTCSKRKVDIWISHDSKYFDIIGDILKDGLVDHHFKLLFPELPEPKPWDLSSLVDELEHPKKIEQNLNSKQKQAFYAIIKQPVSSKNHYIGAPVVITGPTGSGKTHVIAHSIVASTTSKIIREQINRVLICTYSNEAADQYVVEYFSPSAENFKIFGMTPAPLRIYHADDCVLNVSDVVREHCLLTADKASFRYPTIEEIFSYRIIIVTLSTCIELVQLGLPEDTFSCIFIDEATQMIEIESVCPIVLAGRNTKLVLAGDLGQLGPEVFSLEISSHMKYLSLIDRLNDLYPNNNPSCIKLQETYKTQKEIVQFVSSEFYSSSLICTQSQPCHPRFYPLCFSAVIGGDDSVADTGEGFFNMKEVLEIRDRILDLVRAWPQEWGSPKNQSIAVLTSYAAQATGLRIRLKLDGLSFVAVEILPNCLAKQYRVVLISTVRTFRNDNPANQCHIKECSTEYGFFTNRKSINTAFTRALSLVIVVGDLVSLCNVGPCRDIWREYVSVCRRNGSLMGLKHLSSYKPNNIVQTPSAYQNKKFESSCYNIPPMNGSGEHNLFYFPQSLVNPLQPFSTGDFVERGVRNATPLQNSINLNYGISPSQLQQKIQDNIVKDLDITSAPNKNLSNIWNSVGNFVHKNSDSSNSSIWEGYPDVSSVGNPSGVKSIWTKEGTNNALRNNDLPTSSILLDSRSNREVTSYQSPFDLPDVRLLENVSIEKRKPPSKLAVSPYQSISKYPTESYFNGSTYYGPNQFFGSSDCGATSNNLPMKSATVMRPIAPPIPGLGYQNIQNYCTNDSANNPFNQAVRRYGYEPPPRMLRTFTTVPQPAVFENFNSGFSKEPSKNFDFFAELELEKNNGRKTDDTSSSSSSSVSQVSGDLTSDTNFVLSTAEFPQLAQPTDWVQVKSSKKAKSPPQKPTQPKKSKKKTKVVADQSKTDPKELTVEQKIHGLMEMGFEKRQTIRALQACEKDLQRSVEWLIIHAPPKKDARGTE